MKVTNDNGVVTLRPVTAEERRELEEFFEGIPDGTLLEGTTNVQDTSRPHGDFRKIVMHRGEQKLVIGGSADEDACCLNDMMVMSYLGGVQPTLSCRIDDEDGFGVVLLHYGTCKVCGGRIADGMTASTKVCDECAAKCQHTWSDEPSLVLSRSRGLAADRICTICFRPQNPERLVGMTTEERNRSVVEEAGVDVLVAPEGVYTKLPL